MITHGEAMDIARKFAGEIHIDLQEKLLAVFVIGSLGADYYRPGQSDIDTALILNCGREEAARIEKRIEAVQDRYWHGYDVPKGFGAIVFAEEQLHPPYVKEEELVLEIMRLKTQSKLVFGDYDVDKIPMPDKQAIKDDAIAFQSWADGEKEKRNEEMTIRADEFHKLVNSTLIALKRYLMLQHGIVEFNKFKVIDLYLRNEPPLVDQETFRFIDFALRNDSVQVSEEQMFRMIKWHDELYTVINNIVLYN